MSEVLFERRGAIGLVTLNRPQALNALTLGMIRVLHARLAEWAADPAVRAVVVQGAGDRAFCAGGDIRALYDSGPVPLDAPDEAPGPAFFIAEYRLNHAIHHYPKPYVALVDGIAMGGGVGVSVHGSHRVATERTAFAMPECGIGFFPDVGAGWFLPRCPGETGTWLGLTGTRLGAADALYAGLATHFLPSERLPALIEALAEGRAVDDAVAEVRAPEGRRPAARLADEPRAPPVRETRTLQVPNEASMPAVQPQIDRCFAGDRPVAILAAIEADGSPFASTALERIRAASPTALAVALALLRRGRALPYDEVARIEYRLSRRFLAGHDFFEGVRAAIVDKDRRPAWSPATLAEVDPAAVDRLFDPLPAGELGFG